MQIPYETLSCGSIAELEKMAAHRDELDDLRRRLP
jgi:hypothetical protein